MSNKSEDLAGDLAQSSLPKALKGFCTQNKQNRQEVPTLSEIISFHVILLDSLAEAKSWILRKGPTLHVLWVAKNELNGDSMPLICEACILRC